MIRKQSTDQGLGFVAEHHVSVEVPQQEIWNITLTHFGVYCKPTKHHSLSLTSLRLGKDHQFMLFFFFSFWSMVCSEEIGKACACTVLRCWETWHSPLVASATSLYSTSLVKDRFIVLKQASLEGLQEAILSCIHCKYLSKKKFLSSFFRFWNRHENKFWTVKTQQLPLTI